MMNQERRKEVGRRREGRGRGGGGGGRDKRAMSKPSTFPPSLQSGEKITGEKGDLHFLS